MNSVFLTIFSILLLSADESPLPAEPQPIAGKVLVLTNERTLEGDIERVGGQYRIRRETGELWLDGKQVRRLCADVEDAYHCLQEQIKHEDVEAHLRLAGWCKDHGLMDRAAAEARTAQEVFKATNKGECLAARAFLTSLAQTPGLKEPIHLPPLPPPPNFDLTQDAFNQFGTKVQPILMNACAHCHNQAQGTAFRLSWSPEIGIRDRKTLQENVNAVLAFVNPSQPQSSVFLVKAASVHWPLAKAGGAKQAPFNDRHAPAFRMVEDWVRFAIATSPQLAEIQPVTATEVPRSEPPRPEPPTPTRPVELPMPQAVQGGTKPMLPPADPGEFNDRYHHDRTSNDPAPPRP